MGTQPNELIIQPSAATHLMGVSKDLCAWQTFLPEVFDIPEDINNDFIIKNKFGEIIFSVVEENYNHWQNFNAL